MCRARSLSGTHEKCVQSFNRKPEGNRLLERTTPTWKDNTKMKLMETECVDWIQLYLDTGTRRAIVNPVINLLAP